MHEMVERERTRILYKNAFEPLLAVLLVSSIMTMILWNSFSQSSLLLWLFLVYLTTVIRFLLSLKFFQVQPTDDKALLKWRNFFLIGAFVSGCLWGYLAWGMSNFQSAFITFSVFSMLLAMAAGSLGAYAIYPPAYYAYITPIILSLITRLIYEGGGYIYTVFLLLIFLGSFVAMARKHCRLYTKSIEQRFENADLLNDLAEKKEEAEKANAEKTKFLASASHDLRQPMHAMHLFAEGLEHELNTEQQHELLEKLQHSMSDMGGLLNALLDMSKLDAGLVQAHTQAIDLHILLLDLEDEFSVQAEAKGIKLRLNLNHEPCYVMSDMVLLNTMLRNLLSNAIKYTEHGEVLVSYKIEDKQCILKVKDTGMGIDAQHLEQVFQPFFQAHNPERDREQGLGLGLSIVARLCTLLKHECHIDSTVGQGSTFTLILPLADKPAEHATQTSKVSVHQLDANILVIDDDAAILDGMRVMLEPWGCKVFTAASMADLEQALDAKPNIDLVIADYRLPNHELGTDAIQRARGLLGQPELVGIIVSGDTEEKRMKQVQDAGFMMLHKPVRPAQIRSLIQRLLKANKAG